MKPVATVPSSVVTARTATPMAIAQRGAASLAFTGLLVLAMVLAVSFGNRQLIVELRASTNQVRAAQAFEAAEAGLDWVTAQLNDPRAIDAQCRPVDDVSAGSFRSRFLHHDEADATITPVTWVEDGTALPLESACVRDGDAWRCRCPAAGRPTLAPATGSALAPAFAVRFEAADEPGLVRVVVRGCAHHGSTCAGPEDVKAEAHVRVQALLGHLPALRTPPAASLTTRGSIVASGELQVGSSAASVGGLAAHAGGVIDAPEAHWRASPGSPLESALVSADDTLAAKSPRRWFVGHFGLDPDSWAAQPAVRHVSCHGDCNAAIGRAVALDVGPGLVRVAGDATLHGPARLGTVERPILLVVTGTLRIQGDVSIVGLVHGGSVEWLADGSGPSGPPGTAIPSASSTVSHSPGHAAPAAPTAAVRGALLSTSDYRGDAAPSIAYDADVLRRLRVQAGTFARVAGSWRDF